MKIIHYYDKESIIHDKQYSTIKVTGLCVRGSSWETVCVCVGAVVWLWVCCVTVCVCVWLWVCCVTVTVRSIGSDKLSMASN